MKKNNLETNSFEKGRNTNVELQVDWPGKKLIRNIGKGVFGVCNK